MNSKAALPAGKAALLFFFEGVIAGKGVCKENAKHKEMSISPLCPLRFCGSKKCKIDLFSVFSVVW
ncbi:MULTISPECIES: hypothetical protein [Pelosinus]|jgi:hypothetical protein|uniref:hypothetical protein n=1 Tax=Pelosinus TaxID=365348 RepID=UPI0002F45E5A|nr:MULTISPECIES: hypothetical protein [Pelosinus]